MTRSIQAQSVIRRQHGGKAPRQVFSKDGVKRPTKSNPASGQPSKPRIVRHHRHRPGTIAIREIRKYQKSTDPLIRKLPFQRMMRDVVKNELAEQLERDGLRDLRFQASAIAALQEATEAHVTRQFREANLSAVHRNNMTITAKDFSLGPLLRSDIPLAEAISKIVQAELAKEQLEKARLASL